MGAATSLIHPHAWMGAATSPSRGGSDEPVAHVVTRHADGRALTRHAVRAARELEGRRRRPPPMPRGPDAGLFLRDNAALPTRAAAAAREVTRERRRLRRGLRVSSAAESESGWGRRHRALSHTHTSAATMRRGIRGPITGEREERQRERQRESGGERGRKRERGRARERLGLRLRLRLRLREGGRAGGC